MVKLICYDMVNNDDSKVSSIDKARFCMYDNEFNISPFPPPSDVRSKPGENCTGPHSDPETEDDSDFCN